MAGRLLRVLGVAFGVAVAMGGTVGGGILRTPGEVAANLPSPVLVMLAWAAGGGYAFLGACSVAELGAMMPKAGGFTAFADRALGPYAGFLVGWTDWLVSDGSVAALAILLGESIAALAPAARGHERTIAIAAVVTLATIQAGGSRRGGRLQILISAIKGGAITAIAAACLAHGRASSDGVVPAPGAVGLSLTGAVLALQGVIFAYDGWYGVIYFGEEMREPGRSVPRAMFGTVALVTGLYLVFNAALLYALPFDRLAGEALPARLAARTVFGAAGDAVMRLVVIVSAAGTMSSLQLGTPRILYALGRNSRFAALLGRVNRGGTPIGALAVSVTLEIAFILSGTFSTVIAVVSVFLAANYVLTFVGVFALRRREPEAERPFRAWGYPFTTGAALAGAYAFLIAAVIGDTRNTLVAFAVLAVSWPLQRVTRASASGP